jgi:hypothetical protein
MLMEWPSTIADGDAVIVREETPDGLRFVVHSRRSPQFTCRTYAEAEARTLAYAEHARAYAWYADGRGLQLVGGGDRPVPSPAHRHVDVTPTPNQPTHRREKS